MRRLRISHTTRYQYSSPVQLHTHRLLLRPREGHDVRIESSRLGITPDHVTVWHRDVQNNSVATVEFSQSATLLEVASEVVIQHYEDVPLQYTLEKHAEQFPFQYEAGDRAELMPYLQPLFTKDEALVREWVEEFWSAGTSRPTFELLQSLNAAIPARFAYRAREEPGVQRPSETFAAGSGSCRDLATLFMEACRNMGLGARFVSGYLYAPGLPAAEGATHAWSEVYVPGAGWRGFDSTTGQLTGGDHIAVAVARHPESIPPVSGSYEGDSPSIMEVEVSVEQQE
jgi:transglutaminase-like putative cysteine protease